MLNLIQNPFIGIFELRKNLPKILSALKKDAETVVITKQGKPAAVLMGVEYYLELQEALKEAQSGYTKTLDREVEAVKNGKGISAESLYKQLGISR